jgi:hypothetical protein
LKSLNGSIKGGEYIRIGVGIGRTEGREPDVVAHYVLRKMSGQEREQIKSYVGRAEVELRRLAIGRKEGENISNRCVSWYIQVPLPTSSSSFFSLVQKISRSLFPSHGSSAAICKVIVFYLMLSTTYTELWRGET